MVDHKVVTRHAALLGCERRCATGKWPHRTKEAQRGKWRKEDRLFGTFLFVSRTCSPRWRTNTTAHSTTAVLSARGKGMLPLAISNMTLAS